MNLRQAITAAGVESEYIAGDYATVATTLNSKSLIKLDATRRNSTWVMATFTAVVNPETGATEADVILGTLQSSTLPRVVAAREVMAAEGISLADDQAQTMIDVLGAAGGWGQDLIDRVKAYGRKPESYADQLNNGTNFTEADISEEATREARQALIDSYEAAIGANVDLHTMTLAEIVAGLRAAADALEAG